jgi:hypothetical protein
VRARSGDPRRAERSPRSGSVPTRGASGAAWQGWSAGFAPVGSCADTSGGRLPAASSRYPRQVTTAGAGAAVGRPSSEIVRPSTPKRSTRTYGHPRDRRRAQSAISSKLLGRCVIRPLSARLTTNRGFSHCRSKMSLLSLPDARSVVTRRKRGSPSKQWNAYSVGLLHTGSVRRRSQTMRGVMSL